MSVARGISLLDASVAVAAIPDWPLFQRPLYIDRGRAKPLTLNPYFAG